MNRNSERSLSDGRKRLKAAGIETYSLDALVLLAEAAGKTKEWLLSHNYRLNEKEYNRYVSYIEQREKQKPVAYITGRREFMALSFYVNENVLIPRRDTEVLAELVIEAAKKRECPKILDLCTGSGCIAISCAYYDPFAQVTASDISSGALIVAERNAEANGVSERTRFLNGNLYEAIDSSQRFDIIVSNPPYIPGDEIGSLSAAVRDYEPLSALDGGEDGLCFYGRIVEGALTYLTGGGLLFMEIGCGQGEAVRGILNKYGYNNINIYKDLAGRDRVIEGARNV